MMRKLLNVAPIALLASTLALLFALMAACEKPKSDKPAAQSKAPAISKIVITANVAGPIVIATPDAEFDLAPGGYLQAFLVRDGKRLTLDDPAPGSRVANAVVGGKAVADFVLEWNKASVTDATGKLAALGKRVAVTGHSASAGLDETLAIEAYDDFPGMVLVTASYRNAGQKDVAIDRLTLQARRLNAALADAKVAANDLWSFQGASEDWGKDEVLPIPAKFSRPNIMGSPVNQGHGGGVPVNAFWTATVGEAIGHIETLPLVLSMPVKVAADRRIETSLELNSKITLKPGESYATPRSFVAVYQGDFYEPLSTYSRALQREGWNIPKPNGEDYNIAWCGWGYEADVTPAQMLGTIPKLHELGIKWATLDDRWFNNYGDWEPRSDTFPGEAVKTMAQQFHKEGIKSQIWWLPLGVEDGQGKYEAHKYLTSQVAKDHPDWLILDKNGKHARFIRDLAVLCPAVPEVQEYHKKLTEKFIRDWDFDGHKLDNIYTVPACYNPKHHHKSPEDSINAMADVYKVIFQTTRALKPDSVTQSCPCGTTPSIAWLPYMDQAVTADPVGAVQVRRRIKWYKALLGPAAAVYGDHVELSEMHQPKPGVWLEVGRDFASTLGTGGVLGTKFTWGETSPKFDRVALTPEKEAYWKKWTALYNSKMLSRGEFKNLYVYGYDSPEAYAIEKDGRMYYAFYAPKTGVPWKGKIELRGLTPGAYQIHDYVNDKNLGEVDAAKAWLNVEFTDNLLVEAEPK